MSSPAGRLRLRTAILAGAVLAFAALPGAAQADPVVQPLPQESPGMKLNAALNQLARSPQDLEALIAAGRASLELGDVQAAIGFFQRADTLWPGSVRAKTGLAGAFALADDPITAINLFNEAERFGPIDAARTADRGLAYDLVGDTLTAQTYYRQSLGLQASDETLRRLALSQAIAGDRRGMEVTLGPLLQKQDKAAWRTRAFALAILGVGDEAESIVNQTMPEDMAKSMTAYLRYMPKLTPAQQAAASNLGQFPRAAEIGQDDPRFAAYVRPRVVLAAASPAPLPAKADAKAKGKDKGKDKGKQGRDQQVAAAQPAVPSPPVGREIDGKPVQLAAAVPVAVAPKPAPVPLPAPVLSTVPRAVARPAPVSTTAGPGLASIDSGAIKGAQGFDLRQQQAKPSPSPAPAPAPPAPTPPAPRPAPQPAPKPTPESIDEAFADFTPPSREIEPQVGAVDLRHLDRAVKPATSAKTPDKPGEKGKADGKAKPGEKVKPGDKASDKSKDKDKKDSKLSQPSRIWVQVATGRDKSALASDWRRMLKDDPAVFKGKKPFLTAWGQTNRLLTGPFETQKEANAFVAALRKVDFGGAFTWTSAAGQVVDPLGAGK